MLYEDYFLVHIIRGQAFIILTGGFELDLHIIIFYLVNIN